VNILINNTVTPEVRVTVVNLQSYEHIYLVDR